MCPELSDTVIFSEKLLTHGDELEGVYVKYIYLKCGQSALDIANNDISKYPSYIKEYSLDKLLPSRHRPSK